VEILIGKQRGHLTKKHIQEFVDLFARWIEGWLKNSRPAFDRVWAGSTTKFRMPDQPTRGMTWHVKLRNHANATVAGICDDFSYLILGVVMTIRPHLMKLRKLLTFNTKSLVLGQMPMKYIKFYSCHSIEVAFENFNGLEVSGDINQ
jgi:hypothetical protein